MKHAALKIKLRKYHERERKNRGTCSLGIILTQSWGAIFNLLITVNKLKIERNKIISWWLQINQ